VLLRESYRDENGRSQKRTLANLSKLPLEVVAALKALLKGGTVGKFSLSWCRVMCSASPTMEYMSILPKPFLRRESIDFLGAG